MENNDLQILNIPVSDIITSNRHGSSVAGFHFRKFGYPFLHTHSHWEIILVKSGKINHTINGISYQASQGDACLIRPKDCHKFLFENTSNTELITYVFSDEMAKKIFNVYPSLSQIDNTSETEPLTFFLNKSTFDAVISKTISAHFLPASSYIEYSILIINRLISCYVEHHLNSPESYPDWLNDFLYALRNPNIFKQPIPQIASIAPYSYQRLSILFKKYTGKTLVSYIKELKLIYAKEELLHSNKPINEIALDLNYESFSTFNNLFKKETGLTPLEYRKSQRKTKP